MPFYTIIPQAKLPRNITQVFTYSSTTPLTTGDIVAIDFRKKETRGIVVDEVDLSTNTRPPLLQKAQPAIKPIKQRIGHAPDYFVPLILWMQEYYVSSAGFIFEAMMPKTVKREPSRAIVEKESAHERYAHKKDLHSLGNKQIHLIHRIIQSKKLNINTYPLTIDSLFALYREIITSYIKNRQSIILLTPTAHHTSRALSYLFDFKNHIRVLSSEIYARKTLYAFQWKTMLTTSDPVIAIGPRSAIFAPLASLGCILIDQGESDEYKQYDQNPRYDARTVAKKISALTGCALTMFTDGVIL